MEKEITEIISFVNEIKKYLNLLDEMNIMLPENLLKRF